MIVCIFCDGLYASIFYSNICSLSRGQRMGIPQQVTREKGSVVRDVKAENGLIEFLRQEWGRRGGTTHNKSVGGPACWAQGQGGVTRKVDCDEVKGVSGHGSPVNRRTQPGRRGPSDSYQATGVQFRPGRTRRRTPMPPRCQLPAVTEPAAAWVASRTKRATFRLRVRTSPK